MVTPLIAAQADLGAFFRQAVQAAADCHGYDPEAPSAQYLVALLSDYARPGALSGEVFRRPLTVLYREAQEAAGAERFTKLRSLGDDALYLSGFFADHLERRGLGRGLAQSLGAGAYDAAAAMLRRSGGKVSGPDVFAELASNFEALAALLSEVADALHAASARDPGSVLALYERWTRRGSLAVAEALLRTGVLPQRGGGDVH